MLFGVGQREGMVVLGVVVLVLVVGINENGG